MHLAPSTVMLATIGHFIAAHAIAMFMLSVGLRTDRAVFRSLLTRRRLVLRALAVVWIGVPLLAVAVILALEPSPLGTLALAMMAICPGVPLVLRRARKAAGDVDASVLVLVVTLLTAIVMIPLWAVLLTHFTRIDIALRPRDIAAILLPGILIPFAIGRLIHELAPKLAPKLAKVTDVLFLAGIVLLLIVLLPKSVPAFRELGVRDYVAAFVIALGATALGYAAAGPPREQRISLAIAASLGNPALALMALTHVSDRDYATMGTAAVLVFILVRFVAFFPFKLWLDHTGHGVGGPPASDQLAHAHRG
jgi:BASS family bile acid:Na+ symporter